MVFCGLTAESVRRHLEDEHGVNLEPGPWCFKFPLGLGWELSISVPPDAMGNRCGLDYQKNGGHPTCLETLLFRDGRPVYEVFGYDDVLRFYGDESVFEPKVLQSLNREIQRLQRGIRTL